MKASRLIGIICIALVFAFSLAGCRQPQPQPPTGAGPCTAQVRLIHASPDAPGVDVCVGGKIAVTDLTFKESTGYESLPAGSYQVNAFPTGAKQNPIMSTTLNLAPGTDYTVLAIGLLCTIRPLVLVDDRTLPTACKAKVRFVHASPDAPAVDVRVPAKNLALFQNVSFGSASSYQEVDPGTYTLAVTPAGQCDNAVLTVPDVQLQAQKVYTIVAMGQICNNTLSASVYEDR